MPTAAEIRQRCAIIQAKWSPEERLRRSMHFATGTGYHAQGVTLAEIRESAGWTPPLVETPVGWDDRLAGWDDG